MSRTRHGGSSSINASCYPSCGSRKRLDRSLTVCTLHSHLTVLRSIFIERAHTHLTAAQRPRKHMPLATASDPVTLRAYRLVAAAKSMALNGTFCYLDSAIL